MIFVDTNVFVYAVGKEHEHRAPAQQFLVDSFAEGVVLYTSAEVLQELVHVYVRRNEGALLEAAFKLMEASNVRIWPLEEQDVQLAKDMRSEFPRLQARDLCFVASCRRRGVTEMKSFDGSLRDVLL